MIYRKISIIIKFIYFWNSLAFFNFFVRIRVVFFKYDCSLSMLIFNTIEIYLCFYCPKPFEVLQFEWNLNCLNLQIYIFLILNLKIFWIILTCEIILWKLCIYWKFLICTWKLKSLNWHENSINISILLKTYTILLYNFRFFCSYAPKPFLLLIYLNCAVQHHTIFLYFLIL